jgi:hypothetical protein
MPTAIILLILGALVWIIIGGVLGHLLQLCWRLTQTSFANVDVLSIVENPENNQCNINNMDLNDSDLPT